MTITSIQVTNQLSLCGLVEFVFHLSRLDAEMLQIISDSGQLTQSFFTFKINQQGPYYCPEYMISPTHTHKHTHTQTHIHTGRLDANRPVPFRLTPALQALLTKLGMTGPLQMSMLATARCLVQPNISLESILRAVLRDEFISWMKV